MLDHLSFGVPDLPRARAFYDAVLGTLGYRCLYAGDDALGYGDTAAAFWLLKTPRAVDADPQSGLHVSFVAPDAAAVEAFHREALRLGGRDNGAPGLREHYGPGYFAAFAVDPDGYRIEAHCELAPSA